MEQIPLKELPIGFFDSGLGGVSVLAEAAALLPHESFIYLGDTAHSPYGTKERDEVISYAREATGILIKKGIKALVVACNTATSVAINDLRLAYPISIIGMEPALKPAVEKKNTGKIVVMATPMTLREKKFQTLYNRYREEHEIILLPCPGLVELIERGIYQGPPIQSYLSYVFDSISKQDIATIVLGCTHYLFIKKDLKKFLPQVEIIDGNRGTTKNLQVILKAQGLLADQIGHQPPSVTYLATARQEVFLPLAQELYNYYQQA